MTAEENIGNECTPIQLAQCRFPGLAISKAKIFVYFSNKKYGNNFIKQQTIGDETVRPMVSNYQNAGCSLRKKLFYFFYLIHSQLHKIHRVPDKRYSPVEYNCKISRQKTALTDTLKHTQAIIVSFIIMFGTISFPLLGSQSGFVSSRNAPERRSCSFFDHRNAVPVLFGI